MPPAPLTAGGDTYRIFRLDAVEGAARLPYCLNILLENLLRNEDGVTGHRRRHRDPRRRRPKPLGRAEIAFRPARILLQDLTGVPCRSGPGRSQGRHRHARRQRRQGETRSVPVDLVIDHSVIAD